MINRNTPNDELLMKVKGYYNDYILMKAHTRKCITDYLEKHFPNYNDCFKNSTVFIDSFKFCESSQTFKLSLMSKQLLTQQEIMDFCHEFDLGFDKVTIDMKGYIDVFFISSSFEKHLEEETYVKYYFTKLKDNGRGRFG